MDYWGEKLICIRLYHICMHKYRDLIVRHMCLITGNLRFNAWGDILNFRQRLPLPLPVSPLRAF